MFLIRALRAALQIVASFLKVMMPNISDRQALPLCFPIFPEVAVIGITVVQLAKENNLPIVILGKAYKPDVHYLDGSSSILVGHYCKEEGIVPEYDQPHPYKAVYLLGHMGKHHDYKFPKDSIVVDPWRSFKSDNIKVIHYGNTRKH